MVVLFLGRLVYALWPVIYGLFYQVSGDIAVQQFVETYHPGEGTVPDAETDDAASPEPTEMPYRELYEAMQDYNQQIYEEKQEGLADAWSYTNPSFNLEKIRD